MPIFENQEFDFDDIIGNGFNEDEKNRITQNLNNIFISSLSDELSGIVIIGVDKTTMKNGYVKFEMLFNGNNNVLICNEEKEINIKKSEIHVFAQNDVINGFFNGFDETVPSMISQEIESCTNETLNILLNNLKTKTNISKDDLKMISEEIEFIKKNSIIKQEFEDNFHNFGRLKSDNILDEIEIMPKEELMKMNETLINLTRLKRIITSEQVTVDGEVKHYVLSLKNGIEKFY